MNKQEKHFIQIKQMYPLATSICKPKITGLVHDIYIVENINGEKFVCRFSDKRTAEHNIYASELLTKHNIKVPQVSLYKFDDIFCETYKLIEGKTLHEKIITGQISVPQIYTAFKQLIDISIKISDIPMTDLNKITLPNRHFDWVSSFFQFFKQMQPVLCHTDLNAKNVVLDENNNVIALLDLDAVTPSHFNTVFSRLCLCAKQYGIFDNKLFEVYPEKYKFGTSLWNTKAQISLYSLIVMTYAKLNQRTLFFKQCLEKQKSGI